MFMLTWNQRNSLSKYDFVCPAQIVVGNPAIIHVLGLFAHPETEVATSLYPTYSMAYLGYILEYCHVLQPASTLLVCESACSKSVHRLGEVSHA